MEGRDLQQVMQMPPARRHPQKVYKEFYESYANLKYRTVDPEFLKWFIGFTEGILVLAVIVCYYFLFKKIKKCSSLYIYTKKFRIWTCSAP